MGTAVAINGSPRAESGNTAMVLAPLVEGMTEAGYTVDLVYTESLSVRPCTGEMHCWYRKPGSCYLQDDMQGLYPRLAAADTLILATPVFIPLPGGMQNVINRLCPLVEPMLETREGRTRARFRSHVQIRKIVLVATGGWWERENFGVLVSIARELAQNGSVQFAGAVLRPHAFLMKEKGVLTEDGRKVLEAARRAGSELVQNGSISADTLQAIARPLVSQEELRKRYNAALSG